ncbi:MAG: HAD hydrolase family protein, partial [Candidatus Staskawiczbacteria bacterium]|nr:HAD hydrolase family protein [Candidatus Staskawiczbacteria bacterium]
MSASDGAIFLDLDGCLFSEDGGIDEMYYESFGWLSKYIREANVGRHPQIRFCSGRNIPFVEATFLFIGRPLSSLMVIENGVALYDPNAKNAPIYTPGVTPEMRSLFTKILKKKVPGILKKYPCLCCLPGNLMAITLSQKFDSVVDIASIRDTLARYELKSLVLKKLVRVIHSQHTVSIVPPHVNKGTALEFLAQKEEINLRASLGIGDSKADIPFLEKVRFT